MPPRRANTKRRRTFHEAGVTLTLIDRGTHHELEIGGVPILTSALLGTERAFGRLVPRTARRVVVGGLGFGSTLAGVLERVGARAEVLVVEKLTTVIDLVRTDAGGTLAQRARDARHALADPRVQLLREDVRAVIRRERALDCILLDVDNGPDWGSFRSNARLYDAAGLEAARLALRGGGMYAVWSGYPADEFLLRLRKAGFHSTAISLKEGGRVQARAYIGHKR